MKEKFDKKTAQIAIKMLSNLEDFVQKQTQKQKGKQMIKPEDGKVILRLIGSAKEKLTI